MWATIQEYYEQFMTQVVSQPWFYPLLSAIGVCLIFFFFAGIRRHKGLRVYRDESGNALVSRKALQDLVHIACSRIDTASKPKIQICPHRGRLDMTIKVKLYEGQRLNELRDQMRRSVIRTFEESHGIRLGDINILIIGFKRRPNSEPDPIVDSKPEESKPAYVAEDKPKDPVESTVEAVSPAIGASNDGIAPAPIESSKPEETELEEDTSETSGRRTFFTWGKKSKSEPKDELPLEEDSESKEESSDGLQDSKKD